MIRSNILPNRLDTKDYLDAHERCVVARCCQATDRTGVFENILSCKCLVTKVTQKLQAIDYLVDMCPINPEPCML